MMISKKIRGVVILVKPMDENRAIVQNLFDGYVVISDPNIFVAKVNGKKVKYSSFSSPFKGIISAVYDNISKDFYAFFLRYSEFQKLCHEQNIKDKIDFKLQYINTIMKKEKERIFAFGRSFIPTIDSTFFSLEADKRLVEDAINKTLIGTNNVIEQSFLNQINQIFNQILTSFDPQLINQFVQQLNELSNHFPLTEETRKVLLNILNDLNDKVYHLKDLLSPNEKSNVIIKIILDELNQNNNADCASIFISKTLNNKTYLIDLKNREQEKQKILLTSLKLLLKKVSLNEENINLLKQVLGEEFYHSNYSTNEILDQDGLLKVREILIKYLLKAQKVKLILSDSDSNEEIRLLFSEEEISEKLNLKKGMFIGTVIASYLLLAIQLHDYENNLSFFQKQIKKDLPQISYDETDPFASRNYSDFNDDMNNIHHQLKLNQTLESIINEIYFGKTVNLENVYYYTSIYDKEAKGLLSSEGFIIAFYPYSDTENGVSFYPSIHSQDELLKFLYEHENHIDEISWKVAFTKKEFFEELKPVIAQNQKIPSHYISCFIDFVPTLKKDFSRSKKDSAFYH